MRRWWMVLLLISMVAHAGFPGSPFQVIWDPAPISLSPGQDSSVELVVRMPPGHFIYQDKTSLDFTALEGIHVLKLVYPKPTLHEDPVTGQSAQVFMGEVPIKALIRIPKDMAAGEHDLEAILTYQGCTEKLCLRPEETTVQWVIAVTAPAPTPAPVAEPAAPTVEAPAPFIALPKTPDELFEHGLAWAFLLAFIGGLLTSFTPCVLPLLPITLIVIGVGAHRRRHHNFALAVMLTLGMMVSYAVLGSLAAVLGLQLGFLFQYKWFLVLVVAFFVWMSGAMLGFIHLQLPLPVRTLLQRLGGQGPMGAFLAGVSMGFLAAPCVGPVMGAMLAFVGLSKNVWLGFLLLLFFALGMGTLFILAGTFYGSIAHRVKSPWVANTIKKILGVLLLLPALYYLNSIYPWMDYLPGMQSGVVWEMDESVVMARAKAENKPIFADFSAKWCAPCQQMDRSTFRDPRVIETLQTHWIAWKVDATTASPMLTAVLDRYQIIGWPTLLFLSPNGKERHREVGEVVSADQLIKLLTPK